VNHGEIHNLLRRFICGFARGRGRQGKFSLGMSSGVPTQDTARTSQRNGQRIHQKPNWYITITFRISHANLISVFTGGKGWFTESVNCKQTAIEWKKTNPITFLANINQIYNLLSQFTCSLLSPVDCEHVHSLLGHVTCGFTGQVIHGKIHDLPSQFTCNLLNCLFEKHFLSLPGGLIAVY